MTGLARVTSESFLVLGGDTCHHAGQLRPTAALQRNFPVPPALLPSTKTSISTTYFWSLGTAVNSFNIASRTEPFLTISDIPNTLYADPTIAKVSLDKIQAFDADPDFLVILAHDESLRGVLDLFPKTLNGWKAQGLKDSFVWEFVNKANHAFAFSPAT